VLSFQFAGYNDEILDIKYLGKDQSHIVVATNSALIKVFDLKTWDVQMLRGHSDIVLALDVYRDGEMFASSSKVMFIFLLCFSQICVCYKHL